MGPADRSAGGRPSPERARCTAWLRQAVQTLVNDPEQVRLACVLDWWFIARVGGQISGDGWTIDHRLPAHLGTPLRRVLDAQSGARPPMQVLRGPIRFQAALEVMERMTDRDQLPNLRKTPGPTLLGEAIQEAQRLVEAGRRGDTQPPKGLRILEGDDDEIEAWASEVREGHALQRGLKVWYPMVRVLREFAEAARALASVWCVDALAQPPLPEDWRATVREVFGEQAPLVEGCLHPLDWREWSGAGPRPTPPEVLRPEWSLAELTRATPADLGPAGLVRLLPLAREAREAAPTADVPGWVDEAEDYLAKCVNRVESLRATTKAQGVDDAAQWLDLAAESLEAFDVSEARQAIESAVQALAQQGLDPRISRLDQEAAGWQTDLEHLGRGANVPARPDADEVARHPAAIEAWHGAVRALHERAREELQQVAQLLADRAASLPDPEQRAQARRRMEGFNEALERGELARAEAARVDAARLVESLARAAEDRLRPELRRLAERVRAAEGLDPQERNAAEAWVQRLGNRAELGLHNAAGPEALDAVLAAIAAQRPFDLDVWAVVTDEHLANGLERAPTWLPGAPPGGHGPALRVLCWADTAIPLSEARVQAPDGRLHLPAGSTLTPWTLVRLSPAQIGEAPPPGAPWVLRDHPAPLPEDTVCELVGTDRADLALQRRAERGEAPAGPTYVWARGAVEGPWHVTPTEGRLVGGLHPYRVRISAETLHAYFGTLRLSWAGQAEQRTLLLDEPTPGLLLDLGGEPVDALDAQQLGAWFHQKFQTLSLVEAESLGAVHFELDALPAALRDERKKRLEQIFESSRWLVQARREAALAFLDTEEGAREKARVVERAVQALRTDLQAQLDEDRAAANAELAHLHAQIAQKTAEESALRRGLDERLAQARAEAETYEGLANDGRAKALLALMGATHGVNVGAGGGSGGTVLGAPNGGGEVVNDTPLAAPAVHVQEPRDVRTLAKELENRLEGWQAHEVSNLLLTLLTSSWTLMAGPPGVGKSTLARTLLAQLGATRAEGRAVEVVVRREWQDDAAVFGFLHPQRDAWSPGDVGLLELLLRAASATREGNNALFGVLLEELNLAAPEYYLARLLSAMETPDPELSLYGDDLSPRNRHRYPSRIPVGPNVRLVGTVNVDDTVERLSPRFLSRAAVVWFEPTLDEMLEYRPEPPPPGRPVDWASAMAEVMATPDAELGVLRELLHFLHGRTALTGAPTPRSIRAVQRYLAVARNVLPLTVAQDYCVLQRFLPGLRGVGEAAGEAFVEFERLLSEKGFARSALRVGQMRRRGEAVGHFYDLFHG